MTKRAIYKASAFVLRFIDYGDSDRIVTFYTDKSGKLKGIAKGARRSKKRFLNAIEPFCHSTILYSRRSKEGLALIENCDVINHYPGIRADLERTMVASCFIELIDQFTIEGRKVPGLFKLLEDFLGLIEKGNNIDETLRFFELRLLKIAGYEPALERCVKCGTPLDKMESPFFCPSDGGIKCSLCERDSFNSLPVSAGTLKILSMGNKMDTDRIHRLVLSKRALRESGDILRLFIRHILGKELKSLQVFNQIKNMQP
ncbi:MAG: DNA repair protein RecO [Deltaproteobacteria bacterium]|jgi:DNA repair protein RecO (recombination protein O)|nr:DNA repair protein RecO [Deltaproteobacteria bacterium]MBN2844743.1 DNA repair protein RecO [Deltaproteobacteria bacterium]